MSLIITMYVREGIVMASDSRLTLSSERPDGQNRVVQAAVGLSDSNYKTFLAPGNIGVSTYGAADIQGVPIGGFIESFMAQRLASNPLPPEEAARHILAFFREMPTPPASQFHVAGYAQEGHDFDQQVWHVNVGDNTCSRLNPPGTQGASWGGEADILARLLQPVTVTDAQGKPQQPLPHHQMPWQFFTLQDAIDFCVFAIRSTIDALRFQPRPKTVGGPIDVLVIKPDTASWVQRKELHI
jgi:hypothetical protein